MTDAATHRLQRELEAVRAQLADAVAADRALLFLAKTGDVLTASLDLSATMEGVLKVLVPEAGAAAIVSLSRGDFFPAESFVTLLDERGLLLHWHGEPIGEPKPSDLDARGPEIITRNDALLRAYAPNEDLRAKLAKLSAHGLVLVPVMARGKSLGTMVIAHAEREYDDKDLEWLSEVGRRIGAAVENARLFAVAERRGAQLERLQSFSASLAAVRTLAEVADAIITRGRPAFQAKNAVLCLLGRDGDVLEVVRHEGYDEARVKPWATMPIDLPVPLTEVVRSRQPLFFATYDEARARFPKLSEGTAGGAMFVLPLLSPTRPIGSIGLESARPRTFNPEEEADLMAFAWLCAQAIERALLFDLAEAERRRAEEANRAKDEFLAVLSHEIRTPLNAIMGWAKMLSTHTLDQAATAKAIATIERNARTQAELVNDLLDVSRIITGKLKINVAELSLGRVVEAAVDVVRPAAAAKGVKLEVELDDQVDAIMGDAARLQQVIWNLLANGVKFTDRGGRVTLRTELAEDACILTVEDTGQGIAPDFLPYIFERFRQADMGSTRPHGGLGLGLAIVRHLVELHGGLVNATSAGEGMGTTFRVVLPIAPSVRTGPPSIHPMEAAPAYASLECEDELAGLRVLVVDDEPDARDLLASVLEHCHARVLVAGDAAEAFATLERERPDVLVSDIGMPSFDGYQLIKRIRALPANEGGRTPAVALTAYARVEDRTTALLAGFDAHVSKPIDPSQLTVAIAHVTGRLSR